MRSKRIPGWAQVLGTAAAALAFLLVYELAVYRVPLQQIFLPCSYWSGEVIYSKQLAAVVRCGAPQGYFGFNESHAASGTFAAWARALPTELSRNISFVLELFLKNSAII